MPSSSKPLKVGVIGVGLLGGGHARFAVTNPDVDLVAIADPRSSVGRKVARDTESTWYSDYREMLRKEQLDVAIVATPDPLHREPVVAAFRSGVRHVITEKPMATTRADAGRMRDAAEKAAADLYILFPLRFQPLDRCVRYVIQKGLLGAPCYGDVRLDDNISVPTAMWGKRSKEWAGGSSTAHFLFSHIVDLLRWHFRPAEVVEVYAASQNRVLGYTPDLYDAQLTFDSGLLVRIKAEWIRRMDALAELEMGFSGERGSIYYRKIRTFRGEPGLRIDLDRATAASLARHQKALAKIGIRARIVSDPEARSKHAFELSPEDNTQGHYSALGSYFDVIRNRRKLPAIPGFGPLPGLEDALRQVEVVAAIVESAEKKRSVEVRRI